MYSVADLTTVHQVFLSWCQICSTISTASLKFLSLFGIGVAKIIFTLLSFLVLFTEQILTVIINFLILSKNFPTLRYVTYM